MVLFCFPMFLLSTSSFAFQFHDLAVIAPCHGFVTSLLVFHIITSRTKEKNYVSQRTSWAEKEDTSRKIRHLVARGFLHFRLLPGEEWVCFPSRAPSSSKAFGFGNSLTLSLSPSLSLFRSLPHFIWFIILTPN